MKLLWSVLALALTTNLMTAQSILENSKSGECYVRCITQNEFKTVEERILVRPEYTKLEVVPATYKTVEEKVLVKEATKKMTFVPAVYETVQVSYVKKESRTDLTVNPAKFGDSKEVREVYPVTQNWEYTSYADCASPNPADCQVLCKVEKPGSSKTVLTKTLASDASSVNVPVEESKTTYSKQVIKTAARMEEVEVPAVYSMIQRQVVDVQASTKKVVVPAEYQTITKTELVKGATAPKDILIDCKLVSYNALPIFYDLGSAALTSEAKTIIDEALLELLVNKPGVAVEIASHTDSRSSDSYNKNLSQRRADAVVNYLINKGIQRNRLTARGFGESKLVNRCADGIPCSEEEHQQNRRTEFRVVNGQ